uniref:Uncharacterized protein n=1 Tax=Anguilla anguilla TaxID=7936 RepID=A0A0E9QVI8_ANGAN
MFYFSQINVSCIKAKIHSYFLWT